MAKVTSKRQVTIPKAIADDYGIAPGDEIDFLAAGERIHVRAPGAGRSEIDQAERLARFDQATARQQARNEEKPRHAPAARSWQREDLYERGNAG